MFIPFMSFEWVRLEDGRWVTIDEYQKMIDALEERQEIKV